MVAPGEVISKFFRALGRIPGSISKSWTAALETGGGFLTATLIGWGIELFYGFTLAGFVGGIRIFCLLWFASGAAFFVGTIGGFLFGVPKAKTELDSAKTFLAASPSRVVS